MGDSQLISRGAFTGTLGRSQFSSVTACSSGEPPQAETQLPGLPSGGDCRGNLLPEQLGAHLCTEPASRRGSESQLRDQRTEPWACSCQPPQPLASLLGHCWGLASWPPAWGSPLPSMRLGRGREGLSRGKEHAVPQDLPPRPSTPGCHPNSSWLDLGTAFWRAPTTLPGEARFRGVRPALGLEINVVCAKDSGPREPHRVPRGTPPPHLTHCTASSFEFCP